MAARETPTVAEINELLEDLVNTDADARTQLREDITTVFNNADDENDELVDSDTMADMVVAMRSLNSFEEMLAQFDAKAAKAESDAEEAKAAKAATAAKAKADKAELDTKPADKDADKDADAEVDTDTPADAPADATNENREEAAMAASAAFEAPDDNKPVVHTPVTTRPVIGSDITGFTAGAEFRDMDHVSRAFIKKLDQIRHGSGGDNEQRSVVTLLASIGDDRQLDFDNATANQRKIDALIEPKALIASGGYCAPLPVNYDIFGVGSAARPVRDALPTFGATRGGIRYIAPPVLGAYNSAISLWTAANDANPTSPTIKPSLKVNCAAEQTATADAVTLSLIFGNLMTRAFPELVQRHNQLALIQHARFAERTLLNKISAASTQVTTGRTLGAARDLLVAVARANAAYRNRHRIPPKVQLRAIMPEWTRDLLREDIASNMHVENLSVDESTVDRWFADRGLRISWHIDDTFANQTAGGALNDFPSTIKFWIFAEGTFLFLDGGTLDLGVIRDSSLVNTNDYRTFVETFEGIAKVGIEALEVTATTTIGPAPATV